MKKFLIFLAVIAIFCDVFAVWIQINGHKHPTMNTTNMSTLGTEVEQYIFEMKYFENSDNSGAEMFELKISAYTGINKNKVYSYGVQLVNPKDITFTFERTNIDFNILSWHYIEDWKYVIDFGDTQITYFNTDSSGDTASYVATVALNENNNPYVIDIDKKTYAFDFNKRYLHTSNKDFFGMYDARYYVSNFEYFLYKMYNSMSTITQGQGVYDNLNVGLNDVFNIYEYNNTTGKFDILTELGYTAEFMGVKITYIERGARMHSDSMFGQIGSTQQGGVIYG